MSLQFPLLTNALDVWMCMLEELYLTEHLLFDVELGLQFCERFAIVSSVVLPLWPTVDSA